MPVGRCPSGVIAKHWPVCLGSDLLILVSARGRFWRQKFIRGLQPPKQAHPDHAVSAKYPLFTTPGYYIAAAILFGIWWLFSNRLRYWSLRQDETGSVECTQQDAVFSASGIVLFALTLTLAAIMWMKGLMDEWYSTMYGVCYFAASVWTTLPTVYVIALILQRTDGP